MLKNHGIQSMVSLVALKERVRLAESPKNSGVAKAQSDRFVGSLGRATADDPTARGRQKPFYGCRDRLEARKSARCANGSSLDRTTLGLRRESQRDQGRPQAQRSQCTEQPLSSLRQAATLERETRKTQTPVWADGRALYSRNLITPRVQHMTAFGQVKNDFDRFFSYRLEGASCR